MSNYQEVADGQVSPEVPINENNASLGQAFLWAHDPTSDTGLVVGFFGGTYDANTVAAATITATDNATNYVVANRSTRALSTSTSTTNWNNTTTYGRVARAVFASGVLTFHDERNSTGGVFDHAAAGTSGVTSVNGETGVVTITAGDITIADSDSAFAGASVEEALEQLAGASITDGDKGDITVSAGVWTIDNGVVSLAKMADLAQDQFIGRVTASTGVPETATITAAARTVLDDTTT